MTYQAPRFLFRRHEVLRQVRPGSSFMEIGAGNLTLTRELLRHFARGLAVDFTDDLEVSFQKLPDELRKRLEVRNVDFLKENVLGTFECVVACEVMEHIDDDRLFLRKIFASLKPAGRVIISVPAKAAYWSVHDELVGHIRRYERASLKKMAAEAGFSDVRVISYGYPWVNWLSFLRVWLAKKTMTERKGWDQQRQTSMSNHRQIPLWLQKSMLRFLVNKYTVYPFALLSRVFNGMDWSDAYILTMTKNDRTRKAFGTKPLS